MVDTVFDYATQKILVDLDFANSEHLGDRLHGYYRIGLIRRLFPVSHITAKIHPLLHNFKVCEADATVHGNNIKYRGYPSLWSRFSIASRS